MRPFAAFVALFLLLSHALITPLPALPWLVYYSDQARAEAFSPYQLIVLDSQYHPPLNVLRGKSKTLLGYVSLGEVAKHRPYYERVSSLALHENPNWPGSYFVDLRDPLWIRLIIEQLIPQILDQGFDGIFMDTLDNPGHLERTDPIKYRGMTAAAARLVRAIRRHYPDMTIMMNRGYDLIDEVGDSIDLLLGESVLADYDFTSKEYGPVTPKLYQQQLKILQEAKKKHPHLQILTLDYCDPNDKERVRNLYSQQRKNGFHPYVSTVELTTIVPEPADAL